MKLSTVWAINTQCANAKKSWLTIRTDPKDIPDSSKINPEILSRYIFTVYIYISNFNPPFCWTFFGSQGLSFPVFSTVSPEVCSSLGVAYHDAGQPEEALEQHQEALKLRASVGSYWWMTIMGT